MNRKLINMASMSQWGSQIVPLLFLRGGYASHAAADEGDPKQGGSVRKQEIPLP